MDGKVTKTQLSITNKSQEVNPLPAAGEANLDIINYQITKMLIILRRCTGCSASLLFPDLKRQVFLLSAHTLHVYMRPWLLSHSG